MARAIILISVLIALAMAVRAQPNQLSCSIDSDCACGVNKTNGDCAYGNYRYIDTRRQCPDFCTGFLGNLIISCVDGECEQIVNTDSETLCSTDDDCACGVNIYTDACFFGNKQYVNTNTQCPDFCSGIMGNLEIKCIRGQCKQIVALDHEQGCNVDQDCECGVNVFTEQCFYGNKKFVDTSIQCPDFCAGVTGKEKIRCVGQVCTQTSY